jgi:hypothetical protein
MSLSSSVEVPGSPCLPNVTPECSCSHGFATWAGLQTRTKILKTFKPWLAILGIDCWSIFNENLNYSQASELLATLREGEMSLVIFACEVALFQFRSGRYFFH